MNRNISVNVVPSYEEYRKERYISYLETLGENIAFDDDKWVCDKKKKRLSETNHNVTIYFSKVRQEYKEMVKLFAIIRIMSNVSLAVVKNDIFRISEYLDFVNGNLDVGYESAMRYKQYLDMKGLSETTLHGKWGSVNKFYEIMNGYENKKYQMCFANNPYNSHKKHDYKYIPDAVAQQLDRVFYYEDVDETIRCVYWVLRLVPSRISEVLNIKIDCLKPFDGHYCLFIPTWKQNGGRREPIMRCIHIENEGMGGYLISLIHKQQSLSKELQKFMPENKKDALFTYRTVNHMPDGTKNMTNQYRVISWPIISRKLEQICEKYNIRSELGEIYKVTTHQFRHNGITDRLEKGFTVEQVTDITGHHGSTMLLDAYSHLNLKPETILKVQNSVISEIEKDYTAFNGQVIDCSQEREEIIMKNVRAHKVRGGICRDITGCKSDMMNCLECQYFKPDPEQLEYYKEQVELWQKKAEKFKAMPIVRANAERNEEMFKKIVKNWDKFCKHIDFYTQNNYNMSVKVRGDMMTYTDKLKKLISDKKGLIVTSELTEYNIPRQLLRKFTEMGLLEKIDRGAYISPEAFDDEMYRLQARFRPIIFSHDTALYFHSLIDREPINYTVTVYSGYQTTKLKKMGVNTFSIKRDLFELGLIGCKTVYGRPVRMYDVERAICDCIRCRERVNVAATTEAIKRYVSCENKDLQKLINYAEMFKIKSVIEDYLDILL